MGPSGGLRKISGGSILAKIDPEPDLGIGFGPSAKNQYHEPEEQPDPLAGARNLADSSSKILFLAQNRLAVFRSGKVRRDHRGGLRKIAMAP